MSPAQACPVGFAKVATGMPFGLTVQGGGDLVHGLPVRDVGHVLRGGAHDVPHGRRLPGRHERQERDHDRLRGRRDLSRAGPRHDHLYVYGASLAPWTLTSSACVPSGAPLKPTASFSASTSFCKAANLVETGAIGRRAAPPAPCACARPPAGDGACALLADASACPAGTKMSAVVYAGIQDGRTCAACTCTLEGASCDALVVQMGSDYACGVDTADIHGGARACVASSTGVYVPGYHLAGAPTNGTCKPASALSGTLGPSGGHALCCVP